MANTVTAGYSVAGAVERTQQLEDYYRRAAKWAGTSALLWVIWAFTGRPTGIPRLIADHGSAYGTAGLWPAYCLVLGLADLARRARHLFVASANPASE